MKQMCVDFFYRKLNERKTNTVLKVKGKDFEMQL